MNNFLSLFENPAFVRFGQELLSTIRKQHTKGFSLGPATSIDDAVLLTWTKKVSPTTYNPPEPFLGQLQKSLCRRLGTIRICRLSGIFEKIQRL